MPTAHRTDRTIATALHDLGRGRPAYWSYAAKSQRADSFTLFQYPAMMVPAMLHDLLSAFTSSDAAIQQVCDPFLGSGSVLTEAMLHGRSFHGTDVNPMALLIAKVKSGPLRTKTLRRHAEQLLHALREVAPGDCDLDFPGMQKWFNSKSASEISAIRRVIRDDSALWCRRFFWVCLAETVRLSSNSRTSTFKLHIRSEEDLATRVDLSPIEIFESVLSRNLSRYAAFEAALRERGFLHRGRYTRNVVVELADCRSKSESQLSDLLITSPPYGDNTTTVPYGQHSYLPLQCIDLHDIDAAVDLDCLATTRAIDSRSLGGHKENAIRDVRELRSVSTSLDSCLKRLETLPEDRAVRVATFSRDLHAAVRPIMDRLRSNAYMVWVVGNRRVGGFEVPTSNILSDFIRSEGGVEVMTFERTIPSKRMALRNSVTATMSRERVLVFRNGGRR